MFWESKWFVYGSGVLSIVTTAVNLTFLIFFFFSEHDTAMQVYEVTRNRQDLLILSNTSLLLILLFIIHLLTYTKKLKSEKALWCLGLLVFNAFMAPIYWYFNIKHQNKKIEKAI